MIEFSFDMTYKEIERIHQDFKKSRRLLKANSLKDYFKTIGVGLIRIRQIASTLQQAIMSDIGLTPQMIAPYQSQLSQFMYEQQVSRALGNTEITLGDVKNAINTQLNFMREQGNRLV